MTFLEHLGVAPKNQLNLFYPTRYVGMFTYVLIPGEVLPLRSTIQVTE